MARARNIKPAFFRDAKIVSVSFEARILFIGLWSIADYKGRFKYIPIELKMEIFPADNVDVEFCMGELSTVGLIQIYLDNSGATLVQVLNFEKHQNPHVNEKINKDKTAAACLPSFLDCGGDSEIKNHKKHDVEDSTRVVPDNSGTNRADSCSLIPDSCSLIPERKDLVASADDDHKYSFDDFYSEYPVKKSKQSAIKLWNKLKEGDRVLAKESISNFIHGISSGIDPPHPSTYLNNKRWEDEPTGNQNGTRGNETVSKQPDNSATRHHNRLKALYADAVAEEMGAEAVQQVPGYIRP